MFLIFSVFTSVFTPEEAAYPKSPKPNVASAFVPPPCLSVVIGVLIVWYSAALICFFVF